MKFSRSLHRNIDIFFFNYPTSTIFSPLNPVRNPPNLQYEILVSRKFLHLSCDPESLLSQFRENIQIHAFRYPGRDTLPGITVERQQQRIDVISFPETHGGPYNHEIRNLRLRSVGINAGCNRIHKYARRCSTSDHD